MLFLSDSNFVAVAPVVAVLDLDPGALARTVWFQPRFATTPARPCSQAAANTAAPSPNASAMNHVGCVAGGNARPRTGRRKRGERASRPPMSLTTAAPATTPGWAAKRLAEFACSFAPRCLGGNRHALAGSPSGLGRTEPRSFSSSESVFPSRSRWIASNLELTCAPSAAG